MSGRALCAWLLAAGLALAGCSDRAAGKPAHQSAAPAVPVTVGMVASRDVPVQLRAIGNVQAYRTVSVKSQISGQVVQVHFIEGQEVKQGELLFTIDPRPFQAALDQAQANVARDTAALRQAEAAVVQRDAEVEQARAAVARDTAQLENARADERRYRELVDKDLVARQQYDQYHTAAVALEATVKADRAAVDNARAAANAAHASVDSARAAIRADEAMVENARLQLGYTTIRSPMEGRTGNLLLHAGNVVKANDDNPMVVITQIRPIYVSFSLPEQTLGEIQRYRQSQTLRVEAIPSDGAGREPITGEMTFVNNTVDPSTGMIQLKATFPNRNAALWPGQFVDVQLTLTTQKNAVVVPTPAVQSGQSGSYVFVVKPDLTVESRPVKLGRRLDSETVIDGGLTPGERVVTDGQLRLVPGAKVDIKPSSA